MRAVHELNLSLHVLAVDGVLAGCVELRVGIRVILMCVCYSLTYVYDTLTFVCVLLT